MKKVKLIEATNTEDNIYRSNMDPAVLLSRRNQAARVAALADAAAVKAEAAGKVDLAKKLRERAATLTAALERMPEPEVAGETNNTDNTQKGTDNQDNTDDQEPELDKDENQAENDSDDSHSQNNDNNDNSGNGNGNGGTEGNNNDNNDNDETGEQDNGKDHGDTNGGINRGAGGRPTGSTERGGIEGNPDDDNDGGQGSINSGPQGPQGPSGGPEGPNKDNPDNDNSNDGNSSGSEKNNDPNTDQNDQDGAENKNDSNDDYDDDNDGTGTPKIDNNKIQIDPFEGDGDVQLPPEIEQQLNKNKLEIEDELEALKRILSGLKNEESRRGAKDAIKEVLRDRGISIGEGLKEAYNGKSLDQMSDAEFSNLINSTLDLIDNIAKIKYSNDLQQRIKEIKAENNNRVSNNELNMEDNQIIRKDREAIKAREGESSKYSLKNFKSLDMFKINFYRAIKDQVDKVEDEVDTWAQINRRHEDDPSILLKGKMTDEVNENIPSVDVYFDQSASWSEKDVEIGQQAVSVINEFKERGEIKLNIYYFSDHVHSDAQSARDEGCTNAWPDIMNNIRSNNTKNVVIMTDWDMASDAAKSSKLYIDGCVWWIWRNGMNSQELPKKLVGRISNYQYAFTSPSRR